MNEHESIAVELWSAIIPLTCWIAEHDWLLIIRETAVDRWEVWQTQDAGGTAWGHLHRNLMLPHAGIGRSPARFRSRWTGQQAQQLAERIELSPAEYPWLDTYHYLPGPNSNTYVQWVLGDSYRLPRRAIGRRYVRHASPDFDEFEA